MLLFCCAHSKSAFCTSGRMSTDKMKFWHRFWSLSLVILQPAPRQQKVTHPFPPEQQGRGHDPDMSVTQTRANHMHFLFETDQLRYPRFAFQINLRT